MKQFNNMATEKFINYLQSKGFLLRASFDQLTCIAFKKNQLTDAQRDEIRTRKTDIITVLSQKTIPLSFAQQRLWFLDKYEGGSSDVYNVPIAVRLKGNLDIKSLQQSLQQLVERHESLRTVFKEKSGKARQEIYTVHRIELQIEKNSEKDLKRELSAEAHKPFDLAKGPLFRAKLFKLSEQDHVLMLTQHHIISDGWSIGILIKELGVLYNANVIKTIPNLPKLPIQYADFAAWQKQWLQGKILKSQLEYWQYNLKDFNTLAMPTDNLRPSVKTYNGKSYKFQIKEQIAKQLKLFGRETNTTLFMVLLSAFNILLSRYCGQEDIMIGTPIANRNHKAVEGIIGFFVNTLPIRNKLNLNASFKTFLKQVKQNCLAAYDHQDIPFEQIVDGLNISRDPSRTPVFQVVFGLQNASGDIQLELSGLKTEILTPEYNIAKFDLTFNFEEGKNGLVGEIEYNTDLYKPETIIRMSQHFGELLQKIIANPDVSISKLQILTAAEHERLMAWNKTASIYPDNTTLHRLFEKQVGKTPNNIAVVCEESSLSYSQLNEKANQFAHVIRQHYKKLTKKAFQPNTLVGLCIGRNLDIVIGILSILKAGGAYMPLDSEYPQERLQFMLEDTNIRLVLTQKDILAKLPILQQRDTEVICLDTDQEISNAAKSNPKLINKSTDLAYVIYTSGSTGKSKGVMIEHKGVCNLSHYVIKRFGIKNKTKVLQFASICFDASVYEWVGALLAGGELHILAEQEMPPHTELQKTLAAKDIQVAMLPPAILASVKKVELPQLKTVVSGGDACTLSIVNVWGKNKNFINAYGPTEGTVCCSMAACKGNQRPTIGKPIANVQVYVLDKQLNPVPIGIPGELYIGGVGLARGYLNRPELTKERFIENPFTAGEKLYKTGDLARWLEAGNLEFLGRNDHQVKIRGFRIELGEIESSLIKCRGIKECVVIANESVNHTGKKLAAYYVVNPGIKLNPDRLREHLANLLPDYMVPSYFVELKEIPLTANDKLDRKALPIPDFGNLKSAKYTVPRNEIEKSLAAIWCEVLNLEKVGITDNFFAVGGDSILSIQIVAKARDHGVYITPKQLFAHPTIAALALKAETVSQVEAEQGMVAGKVDLTPIQHWFFEQNFKYLDHWNQSQLILVPNLDLTKLSLAFNKLIEHHDGLRLRYHKIGNKYIQSYVNSNKVITIQHCDLAVHKDKDQKQAIIAQCTAWQSKFNIEKGLVMSVGIITGHKNGKTRLFMAIHHLVVDGVSWRILLSDLQKLYQGESLLPKTSSFKTWSKALTNYAQQANTVDHLIYWQEMMAATSKFKLPFDKTANELVTHDMKVCNISVNKIKTNLLLRKCSKAYNTQINDLLLSALAKCLFKWTRQKEIVFNLEGHGREECVTGVDVTRTMGWFTSLFPVKLKVFDEDIAATIKSIKEQLRQIPDNGLSYGVLCYCHPDKSIRNKLNVQMPKISFNYLGQFDSKNDYWEILNEPSGYAIDLKNHHLNLLDINSMVIEGELHISITYSEDHFVAATIQKFTELYQEQLLKIIAHCAEKPTVEYTPSDFPLAKISQQQLDNLSEYRNQNNNIEKLYPLTSLQEGLLFHNIHSPNSDQYSVQIMWQYRSNLDKRALKQAWEQLVKDHDILRTFFIWEAIDKPLQCVVKKVNLLWHEHNLGNLNAKAQQQEIKKIREQDRRQGYDLTKPCAMRLYLIKCGEQEHTFIWSNHHILLDGWCLSILVQQLQENYKAITKHQAIPYRDISQYDQFISWLQRQDKKDITTYWKKQLQYLEAPTDITIKKTGVILDQNKAITRQGEQTISFTALETTNLQQFVQEQHITLNTLVQFAYALVLQRYSGADYTVHGATVSGRSHDLPCIDQMVGLFINTLPVTIDWTNNKTATAQLQTLNQQIQEVNNYSYISLNKLQKLSAMKGHLFNSIFIFENYPEQEQLQDILSMHHVQGFEKTNYPLSILSFVQSGCLTIKAAYDQDCFTGEVIKRLTNHLQHVINAIITTPGKMTNDISILTDKEYQQIAVGWNKTIAEYPKDKTIQQLFESQVKNRPDAMALLYRGKQITYRELNKKANQLAHAIREQYKFTINKELTGDVLVGLCMERNFEMAIAILAILKSGGAYVPLDPKYPQERLEFMLQDSSCKLILTQTEIMQALPFLGKNNRTVICVDEQWKKFSKQSKRNPIIDNKATNIAYVIYTSGSTGKPKGVLIEHRSVVNFLIAMQNNLNIKRGDKLLSVTSISFDIFGLEFYLPLISGAVCLLTSKETIKNIEKLKSLIESSDIDIMQATPSMWSMLFEAGWKNNKKIKLLSGGEALSNELSQKLLNKKHEVWNLYGPTETTIWSTAYKIRQDHNHNKSKTIELIGKPIPNTTIYVLDRQMRLVPADVSGELYIGGAGLAQRYLNLPKLTNDRFIGNPFKAGERLYKTGDLVRWLSDGNLEFMGRIDEQVKVRGFRIELGEIESVLNRHKDISRCVVVVREDEGQKRLVAYHIANVEIDTNKLRDYLAQELPDYMIPAIFIKLNKLPLTPNGKLDRKALPKPGHERFISENKYVAPKSHLEQKLAQIWTKVLKLDRVSVQDNFFSLGGDSIMSIQIISRARTIGIPLTTQQLFSYPTIAELSTRVGEESKVVEESLILASDSSTYVLSPLQEGFLFHSLYAPDSGQYCTQIYWEYIGALDSDVLKVAWKKIIRRYSILRTGFKWEKLEQPVQVVNDAVAIPWCEIDWSNMPYEQQKNKIETYLINDREKGFDLQQPCLMRLYLIKLNDNKHIFIWNHHHILLDGWSISILMEELNKIYVSIIEKEKLKLQNAPGYGKYITWIQQQNREEAKKYWHKHFSDLEEPTTLNINSEKLNIHKSINDLREKEYSCSEKDTANYQMFVKKHCFTLNTLVQLAWAIVLAKYSGKDDVVFGTTVSGRPAELSGIERIVGLCINTLPVRLNLRNTKVIDQLIKLQRQIQLSNQYSYLTLNDVQSQSSLPTRSPLFYSLLVFENYPIADAVGESNIREKNKLSIVNIKSYGKTNYPLTLVVAPGKKLSINVAYDGDCFTDTAIERLINHIENTLNWLISNPLNNVTAAEIVDKAEKKKILQDWNQLTASYSAEKPIQTLIETQVEKTPDAIAVVYENKKLTYNELNAKANKLAHYLINQDVGPNKCVPILMYRSLEAVIAMLAVCKSSGTFVPLEPDCPLSRLQYIIENCRADIVLTQSDLKNKLPDFKGEVFDLEQDYMALKKLSVANPICRCVPDDLVYVIYTSGSTGKPKGVMISHYGFSHYIQWASDYYGCSKGCGSPVHSSLAFDLTLTALFTPLINGKIVFMLPDSLGIDGLLQQLQLRQDYGLIKLTPAHLRLLQSGLDAATVRKFFATVVIGGESLYEEDMAFWRKYGTKMRFINEYGATETSVACTIYEVEDNMPNTACVTVGKAIANSQMYVLDDELNVLPIGIIGEIYLSGVQSAVGYLNQPELTRERFLDHPFRPGEKIYKTRDAGRMLPDGNVEFLGRIDSQVKIRGFRVELEEVESILNQHTNIRESAVIVWEDEGQKHLVAYYVLESSQNLRSEHLKQYLKQQLPDYMIPTYFVTLDKMPLNINGKIDRKALPSPDRNEVVFVKQYIAPRNEIEQKVANIWARVLKLDKVGMDDDFFSIGGYSLLALKLVVEINSVFDEKQSVAWVFRNKTIAEQAGFLNKNTTKEYKPILCFNDKGEGYPMFFVHPGGFGGAEVYLGLANLLDKKNLFYAIEFYNLYSEQPIINSIDRLADKYIEYIRSVKAKGPYYLGGWSSGGLMAYEIARKLKNQGEQIINIYMLDTMVHTKNDLKKACKLQPAFLEQETRAWRQILHKGGQNRFNLVETAMEYMINNYKYLPYNGAVTLFKAIKGMGLSNVELVGDAKILYEEFNLDITARKTNGWNKFIQNLQVIEIDSDHYSMMQGKALKKIVKHIQNDLE